MMLGAVELVTSKSYASDVFENTYSEKIYRPIPETFVKIKSRVETWKKESLAEIQKMHTTTHPKVVAWRKAILGIRPRDDYDLMRQINRITNNAVTYVEDYDHYNKDYWAPPYITLTEGGDCEDLALLKVAALYMHNWPVQQKSNILVGHIQSNGRQIAHAVLEVDIGGERYVLRNFTNSVIRFNDLRPLMEPLYMMNTEQLVLFNRGQHLAYRLGDEEHAPAAGQRSKKPYYNE